MSQDRDARVVLRELLLDTFGQRRGAARLRVLGHDDDRRVLALAETLADEFGQLVDFRVHFGDDGRFGTGAIAPLRARYPAVCPITSTKKSRSWLDAVSRSLSTASMIVLSAVS